MIRVHSEYPVSMKSKARAKCRDPVYRIAGCSTCQNRKCMVHAHRIPAPTRAPAPQWRITFHRDWRFNRCKEARMLYRSLPVFAAVRSVTQQVIRQ